MRSFQNTGYLGKQKQQKLITKLTAYWLFEQWKINGICGIFRANILECQAENCNVLEIIINYLAGYRNFRNLQDMGYS